MNIRSVLRIVTLPKTWIFIVLLALASSCFAQGASDTTFDHLAKIERFAFGGTGYAGVTSDGEKDYKLILSRASALQDFERLYVVGNLQAKCYALAGIHKLDPKKFKQMMQSLNDPKANVVIMEGCIVDRRAFVDIAKRIAKGEYSHWA